MTSLRQAWRGLVRRPVFTIAVVLTMTAGIGVTTASFSIVDGVLLRALPFPNAGQLVSVYEASPSRRERLSLVAPARLADWNRLNRTFEAISGSYSESVTDTSNSEPERLEGRRVMPRFFDVYAMTPLVGRTLVAQEEQFGGPTVAVISEPFWTRRFARDPSAVGRRLTIAGRGYTIVGVMPRAFTSGLAGTALGSAGSIDLWIPAQISPELLGIRQARFLGSVGRMRPGVTIEAARNDLASVQRQLGEQYPATDKDWGTLVMDLKETRVGEYRMALLMIFGAVPPAVIGRLMIVPHHDHREAAMEALQVGIGAIGGVAQPIVGQGDDLAGRFDQAAGQRLRRGRVFSALIFVEIVAEVEHEVEIVAPGGMGVGVEPAEGQVRAGEDADPIAIERPFRQGTRAADRRECTGGIDEAVEPGAAVLEAAGDRLHAPVMPGFGGDHAASDERSEIRPGRELVFEPRRIPGRGHVASPQHHGIGARLAAGDIVGEAARGKQLRRARHREGAETERPGLEQQAAIQGERHGGSSPPRESDEPFL